MELINNILFVAMFFFFRVVYQAYIIYRLATVIFIAPEMSIVFTPLGTICNVISCVLYVTLYLLNLSWF